MPKTEEIRTHRVDVLYNVERCMEAFTKYRGRIFLMLTFVGFFLIAEGLMFAEKGMGKLTENGFWAYTFIILGLMFVLKAAVSVLVRPWK